MRLSRTSLALLFIGGAVTGVLLVQISRLLGPAADLAPPLFTAGAADYTEYERTLIRAIALVEPSTVSVRTHAVVPGYFEDREQSGLGTGVIVTSDGYILTNNHVIDGAQQIIVTLNNGKQYPARSLGGDPRVDLAVLKINAKGLKPAPLADSDKVVVGQIAIAIGNPLGFEKTVTSGIVSGKERTVGDPDMPELENLIQTSAAINPGNSGGPLVDSEGRVMGINTLVIGGAPGGGMGFAVPINYARRALEDVRRYGRVRRPPRLGVAMYNVSPSMIGQGLPQGVFINPQPGGPAWDAGLRPYDIITRIDQTPMNEPSDLIKWLRGKNAGDTAKIKAYRPDTGERLDLTATLEESGG